MLSRPPFGQLLRILQPPELEGIHEGPFLWIWIFKIYAWRVKRRQCVAIAEAFAGAEKLQ